MPKFLHIPFVCALLCSLALVAAPRQGAPATRVEIRGLWVVRTALSTPASVKAMVEAARANGFNTLLVQVRGRGEAFYESSIDPRASALDARPSDFDPLALTIAEAHRAGLRVHAWVNVNLIASATNLPLSPTHVARRHPEWLMVPRALAAGSLRKVAPATPAYLSTLSRWSRAESSGVEGLFLSPLHPGSRDYTVSVLRELAAKYAVDGVHLDYLRFPTADFDYGAGAVAAFRQAQLDGVDAAQRARLDRAEASDPAAWPRAMPREWDDFRRNALTDLLTRIRAAVIDARPDATLSAAVFPDAREALTNKMQDWAGWARQGLLDAICPMIYTTDSAGFANSVTAVRAAAGTVPVWAGIGAYRLPAARTSENVRAARRLGAAGVLVFSYDSLISPEAPSRNYLGALRPVLVEAPGAAGGR